MRCLACNDPLNNRESTRKSPLTGVYYDLCDKCLGTISDQIQSIEGIEDDSSEGDGTEGNKSSESLGELSSESTADVLRQEAERGRV